MTELRTAVNGWVSALDPAPREVGWIDLAVSELLANAVEHAYSPGRPGPVRLHAELGVDGVVSISVEDDGTWHAPTVLEDTRGRGLWMAGAVVDDLHLDHEGEPSLRLDHEGEASPSAGRSATDGRPGGTRAVIRHRLLRPAVFSTDAATAPSRDRSAGMPFSATVEEGRPRLLRISGALDITTAAAFADKLSITSRGGVHPLIVDLTDVEVLASACVSVLFTAHQHHTTHDTVLSLIAPPGSICAQVLDLVGLDHTPTPSVQT